MYDFRLMRTSWLRRSTGWMTGAAGAALLVLGVPSAAVAGGPACAAAKEPIPAAMAYAKGDFADAETLYQQALLQVPKDADLTAGLARARLRQGKVAEAETTVTEALAAVAEVGSAADGTGGGGAA